MANLKCMKCFSQLHGCGYKACCRMVANEGIAQMTHFVERFDKGL
jgi:hypothetical protein